MNSYRDTWAEISLDNITHNVQQFRGLVEDRTRIMAVVKADGYGHGAVEAAHAAIEAGATYLGVALLDEALILREAGILQPILVLGYTPVRSVQKAVEENITITICDREVLEEVILQAHRLDKRAPIHLKIDTGMMRLGVTNKQAALTLANVAISSPYVELEGVFTHFANADCEDPSYTYKQFQAFLQIVAYLAEHGITIPIQHCCNSAAAIRFPNMHLDMVRIGVALYGLYPSDVCKQSLIQLKQVMSLKTKIAAVKQVRAGQPVSYGCAYQSENDRMIATLPIGYADGVSRLLSNQGSFLVQGRAAGITGRVCMDQTMIDITNIPDSRNGTEAVLFGKSHSTFQGVDKIADWMGTINYEVVCLIGKRVPRVYIS